MRHRRRPPAGGNYKMSSIYPPFRNPSAFYNAYSSGRKAATKVARGYTTTKTQRLRQRAIVDGQGGSRSKFTYGKRKLPKGYRSTWKALAKNYLQLNGSSRLAGSVGVQTPYVLVNMFTQSDLNTINGRLNSGNKTNRILYHSVSASAYITNQDQGNVIFEIYDCIARRDLAAANVADPVTAWENSYVDQGGANTDYKFVGTTPFSSDLFTQYFKVCKITHVILGQGQMHQHQIHFAPKRLVDAEYIQYMQNGAKGLTCFSFIVARGAPYNDNTTKTTVSTGQVSLDIVFQKQYKYTYISDTTTNWQGTNSLPASFPVSQAVMDIGSGVAAAADTPA